MPSAHYLVGQNGLPLAGFKKYIEPELVSRGCTVPDRLQVDPGLGDEGNILISLVGEGNLEEILEQSIEKAGVEAERDRVEAHEQHSRATYISGGHQVKFYQEVGTYEDDQTATGLFKAVSLRFLIEAANEQISEVDKRLDELSQRFSRI